jgi:uncharacterized protein (TIGR02246 family)
VELRLLEDRDMRLFLHLSAILAVVGFAAAPAHAADDAGVNAVYGRLGALENSHDASKLDAIYTPDAVYLSSKIPPVVGRQAIKSSFASFWNSRSADGSTSSVKYRVIQRIWHGRNAATDIGYGMVTRTYSDNAKKTERFYAKFLTLALRQADGSWRWRVDIDNSVAPETADAEFDALKPVGSLRYDK